MFEDLDWKSAIRRAAIAAFLYLLFVYVLGVAYPDTFGAGGMTSAVVVAVVFFFFYAILFAFTDRSKRRRLARNRAEAKGEKPRSKASAKATNPDETGDEEAEASELRGRHNPNTSRRKTARRRRR